jgi:multicomponent Na+:H+ antiporter subunit B
MIAILWSRMNAVDVAFTEAAVGAGISTVLMLAAAARVGRHERPATATAAGARGARWARWGALAVCALMAAALLWGARDMPRVGDPEAPALTHPGVARHYIEESDHEIGPPNMVTSVLGDYRGYDTLGETVVIFTAGFSVMLLLRLAQSHGRREEEGGR